MPTCFVLAHTSFDSSMRKFLALFCALCFLLALVHASDSVSDAQIDESLDSEFEGKLTSLIEMEMDVEMGADSQLMSEAMVQFRNELFQEAHDQILAKIEVPCLSFVLQEKGGNNTFPTRANALSRVKNVKITGASAAASAIAAQTTLQKMTSLISLSVPKVLFFFFFFWRLGLMCVCVFAFRTVKQRGAGSPY